MKKLFIVLFVVGLIAVAVTLVAVRRVSITSSFSNIIGRASLPSIPESLMKVPLVPKKTPEELLEEARRRSGNAKGVYMTANVAYSESPGATRLRNEILGLVESTEINALVIDVKEGCGPDYNEENLKKLLVTLQKKDVWTIARIVVFKDASQINLHPEWYVARNTPLVGVGMCGMEYHGEDVNLWRDYGGGYWLDAAHDGVLDYITEFSKTIIDLGFDELQFDYIRFPSDGDMLSAVYPAWDGVTPKYEIIKYFSESLYKELKAHKAHIMLSADLFGFTAVDPRGGGIGQKLTDMSPYFDYISFMLYPSHYYDGFYVPQDIARELPIIYLDPNEVRMQPDVMVGRSLIFAQDLIGGLATSSRARFRPWLEDFYHDEDREAGRPYGAEKVRMQIDATEETANHGWLLWSMDNKYSVGAFKGANE